MVFQSDSYLIIAHHLLILKYENYMKNMEHVKQPHIILKKWLTEATNKTLLRIVSRMMSEEPKRWPAFLRFLLWAYRTSTRTSTQETPFSLVYGPR